MYIAELERPIYFGSPVAQWIVMTLAVVQNPVSDPSKT